LRVARWQGAAPRLANPAFTMTDNAPPISALRPRFEAHMSGKAPCLIHSLKAGCEVRTKETFRLADEFG
jgi:hypothetical protein